MITGIKNIVSKNKVVKRVVYSLFVPTYRKWLDRKKNKQFLSGGHEALDAFYRAAKEADVPCWLSFGTLLGAIRNGGFIRHDNDIDIGAWHFSYSADFEKILRKYDFEKILQIEVNQGCYALEQSWKYKNVKVDIFYHFEREDKMYCHAFYYESPEKQLQLGGEMKVLEMTFSNTGFSEFLFEGIKVLVPMDSKKYLIEQYGEDYMIPQKKWDYTQDPCNMRLIQEEIGIVTLTENI